MAKSALPLLLIGTGALVLAASRKTKRKKSSVSMAPPPIHDVEKPLPVDDPNAPLSGRSGGILWRGRYSRPPTLGEIFGGALGEAISQSILPLKEKTKTDIERSVIEGEGGYIVEISKSAGITWEPVGFVILRKEVEPYALAMIRGMRGF